MRSTLGWMSLVAVLGVPGLALAKDLVGHCTASKGPCGEGGACEEGAVCAGGNCLVQGAECSLTEECTPEARELCIATYGACETKADCNPGDQCGEGHCVSILVGPPGGPDGGLPEPDDCKVDGDCPEGGGCTRIGICAPRCAGDEDCGPGTCDMESNRCVLPGGAPCKSDEDCRPEGSCDTERGECAPPVDVRSECDAGACENGAGGGPRVTTSGNPEGGDADGGATDGAKDVLEEKKADAAVLCSAGPVGTGRAGLTAGLMLLALCGFGARRSRRERS